MPTSHHQRYNSRPTYLFQAPHDGQALRTVSFDEATLLAATVNQMVIGSRNSGSAFSLRNVIERALMQIGHDVAPEVFQRPVFELMQRFVAVGAVVDVTPSNSMKGDLLGRVYRPGVHRTMEELAGFQLAADALGLPYVAHRYENLVVRVHAPRPDGDPGIGSGIVLAPGLIVTNAHVVAGAKDPKDVCVSWGDSPEVVCDAFRIHPDELIDLAVVVAPGFEAHPIPWIRDPLPAEDVVALAYPLVPEVYCNRPQLVFTGTVATSEPVSTYYGQNLAIANAVMPPGASGGPVFGRDGRLVGLIVNMLEGQRLEDGRILTSTLHAFVPGEMLVQKLPEIHPQFIFLNRFGTEAELRAVIDGHEDKWWIPGSRITRI